MDKRNARVIVAGVLFVGLCFALLYGLYFTGEATPPPPPRHEAVPGKLDKQARPRVPARAIVRTDVVAVPLGTAPGAPRLERRAGAVGPNDDPAAFEPSVFPLTADGIRDAVEERQEELHACYETQLHHTPDLAGMLTLGLEVEPGDGDWAHIASVDVIDAEFDAVFLEGCVATVFEELRFDAVDDPVLIRYPVEFSPEDP